MRIIYWGGCLSLLVVSLLSCSKGGSSDTTKPVPKATEFRNVAYGQDAKQQFDIFLPAERSKETPVMVYVHGGGWTADDKSSEYTRAESQSMLRKRIPQLLKSGYAVVNINYRLADSVLLPQGRNKFPAQLDDIKSVLDYVDSHATEYNIKSGTYILAGHSAGAHLITVYTFKTKDSRVKALIPIAGVMDLTARKCLNYPVWADKFSYLLGYPYEGHESVYTNASAAEVFKTNKYSPPVQIHYSTNDNPCITESDLRLFDVLKAGGITTASYGYNTNHGFDQNHIIKDTLWERAILWMDQYTKK